MDYKLCYKVIPMPCNTNSHGDIFGGGYYLKWI